MSGYQPVWEPPDGEFGQGVVALNSENRNVYAVSPKRIRSDVAAEKDIYQGLYRQRRLVELVQNGADAIGELGEQNAGRIRVVLAPGGLYCANEGAPFSIAGVQSLQLSFASPKSGTSIGRFGRGFKSVLGLTDEPHVFSRSGSFTFSDRFSRAWLSEEAVLKKYLAADPQLEIAFLAVAQLIDPTLYRERDEILAELMEWATTVVFLPFSDSSRFSNESPSTRYDSLASEFASFDAEFLIFAKNVSRLEFEVRGRTSSQRSVTCSVDRLDDRPDLPDVKISRCVIQENADKSQHWHLLEPPSIPLTSEHAGLDVNRRYDDQNRLRPVPISWAIPSAIGQRGSFWFFFPTQDSMSLGGIANAPWDTNSERVHLLHNGYNKMLVGELAKLAASAVPFLSTLWPDDPAAYLEVLPARGREEDPGPPTWIVDGVKAALGDLPSLPDLDGNVVPAANLSRPPENVPLTVLEAWALLPGAPRNMVHWRAVDPSRLVRGARVREILERHGRQAPLEIPAWLELLVGSGDAAASIRAIDIARRVAEINVVFRETVALARVVLLADGTFGPLDSTQVRLPGRRPAPEQSKVVHLDVVADPGAAAALRDVFDFSEFDQSARLQQMIAGWASSTDKPDWTLFWETTRSLPAEQANGVIREHLTIDVIYARTEAEIWRPLSDAFLAGEVVQAGGEDAGYVIDGEYHAEDLQLLWLLGAASVPMMTTPRGPLVDEYRGEVSARLKAVGHTKGAIENALRVLPDAPSHLGLLGVLGAHAAGRLTALALQSPGATDAWGSAHLSDVALPPFVLWVVQRRGTLTTSQGPRSVSKALHPSCARFARVLPVAIGTTVQIADLLSLPTGIERLADAELASAVTRLADELDDAVIGEVLAVAAQRIEPPDQIRCRVKDQHTHRAASEVVVVSDHLQFRSVVATGAPAVMVPSAEAAAMLQQRWRLRGSDALQESFDHDDIGDPELLTDVFFLLGELRVAEVTDKYLQRCSRLVRVSSSDHGRAESRAESGLMGDTVYFESLDESPERSLRAANRELKLDLREDEFRAVLENKRTEAVNALINECRSLPNDESRVRRLFTTAQLKRLLPTALVNEVGEIADDPAYAAGLALAVHGFELLQKLKAELESAGLHPPATWAGGRRAMSFVRDLGFDPAFAGFKSAQGSQEELFGGPVALNPLHDYQRLLAEQIKNLVLNRRSATDGGWRGLLFLPTGAGKTRVAVQALLELVVEQQLPEQPIIVWVAQTEELCEQAVQAFRQVWGAMGTTGSLLVGRLWSSNEVGPGAESDVIDESDDWQVHVVVATDEKLDQVVRNNPSYDWLLDASVVVVDEAHHATSPQYTRLLDWLGTGTGRQANRKGADTDQRPLLGLTATPFKSNDASTKALQARFGRNPILIRRPVGVAEADWSVEAHLRDIKVLARPIHRVLDGIDVDVSETEVRENAKSRMVWLPTSVEARIAENRERNRRLLDDIAEQPGDWPILVFAVSVVHAQLLAAQLKLRGIDAEAVSASTSRGARRHYIKQFRDGKLRVLTNFGVLTTGFDAPSTRAIYIARPTFSQSLYMQMIGRGLRGELNGGKDTCLIVDMKDNISRFEGKLAYNEVAHLWTDSAT